MKRLLSLSSTAWNLAKPNAPYLVRHFHNACTLNAKVKIIDNLVELRAWRKAQILDSKTVGFVPTMGALHDGHLSLVKNSMKANDNTVVSIFVNPSQFAPHEDLSSYPRTLETDVQALESVEWRKETRDPTTATTATTNEIIVFVPSVKEMYPLGISIDTSKQVGAFVEVKGLSEQLEGSIRPHFFRGVATIVTKLINAVGPDRIYFGQKDIQQVTVIKRMVEDLLIPTEVVTIPTVREHNSLAMSSRNEYLSPETRSNSGILYKALSTGEGLYKSGVIARTELLKAIHGVLEPYTSSKNGYHIDVEYISISDRTTLKEIDVITPGLGAVISAAIRVPNKEHAQTRIIDNILLD